MAEEQLTIGLQPNSPRRFAPPPSKREALKGPLAEGAVPKGLGESDSGDLKKIMFPESEAT